VAGGLQARLQPPARPLKDTPMTTPNDPAYLLTRQYNTADNLNARIALHRRFSTNHYGWQRFVFDHLLAILPAQARILEVGCGPADLWRTNLDRLPPGWRITLADFSPGMLDAARHALASPAQFTSEVADAQSLPFADAAFGGALANHMLYHVPDRAKALAELRRVLKPNATLFAATNGERHLIDLGELLRQAGAHDAWWRDTTAGSPFSIENGLQQLAQHFPHVDLRLYDDALEITETDPLVAYVLSTYGREHMTDAGLARFRQVVDQEITAHGSIHITKSTGLFIAS
jgi:SAM-dependent methyltransferase